MAVCIVYVSLPNTVQDIFEGAFLITLLSLSIVPASCLQEKLVIELVVIQRYIQLTKHQFQYRSQLPALPAMVLCSISNKCRLHYSILFIESLLIQNRKSLPKMSGRL